MEVFKFEKTLLNRLEESRSVLSYKDDSVPASRVRAEWSYYVEVQIEPTGWQALWKIPRVICEEFRIKYPTIVLGVVEAVQFKELKAVFNIVAVENDDIHLPEQQEVNLEDLWPTKEQEIPELNVERTADCIDQLRFFYNNIWMPWDNDNDDDLDWANKYLESRIQFYYDLNKKEMSRGLAAHIKSLLAEARYIQSRRAYLELGLSDCEEEALDKSQVTDLMRMHLRLSIVKSEIELLENPAMRKIYDDENYGYNSYGKETCERNDDVKVYIITKPHNLKQQIEFMEAAKKIVGEEKTVMMCLELQVALNLSSPTDEILLTPGVHSIKFLECLNNGKLLGLPTLNETEAEKVIVTSQDEDTTLLVFDGDYEIENVNFDCRNIRTGILAKKGTLRLKNCSLSSLGISSTNQAIVAGGDAKIILENCEIKSFATGIALNDNATLEMKKCIINFCDNGIEFKDSNRLQVDESSTIASKNYGLLLETNCLSNKVEKKKSVYSDLDSLKEIYCETIPWSGSPKFLNNEKGNIMVTNLKRTRFSAMSDDWLESPASGNGHFSSENGDSTITSGSDIIVINDSTSEVSFCHDGIDI